MAPTSFDFQPARVDMLIFLYGRIIVILRDSVRTIYSMNCLIVVCTPTMTDDKLKVKLVKLSSTLFVVFCCDIYYY